MESGRDFDAEKRDEQSQPTLVSRRRMLVTSAGLATAMCGTQMGVGMSEADSVSGLERTDGCTSRTKDCDGTSFAQIRRDGLNREVQLNQSIEMMYYGQSEMPGEDSYMHEFAVGGLGSTRFNCDDEEFCRSYRAALAEAEFTVSSRDGHNLSIVVCGRGVPDEGSYTSSDIVIDDAEAVSDLLLERAPRSVQQPWEPVQVAGTLHDDSSRVDSEGSSVSGRWTMDYYETNFGYDGQTVTDMTQYVRLFVFLPKTEAENEFTEDTLDVEMRFTDDKRREHGAKMSYDFNNLQ